MTAPRRRALVGLAVLLLLLLAVAVASTGSVPAGSGGARKPSEHVLDVLFSLFVLLMAFGAVLWGYLLLIRKSLAEEGDRPKRSPWASAVILVLVVGLLAVLIRWGSFDELRPNANDGGIRPLPSPAGDGASPADTGYQPEFSAGPVLVVLFLLAAVAYAWYRSYRARRRRLPPLAEALLPLLADVLQESLDDLRAEPDPRRAVIAAYARMERALAAYGLPRSPAEGPDEYLQRIFSDLDVSGRATSNLTALFARAKFSTHDVDHGMKQDAIDALEAIREELRAAELLAEQQRALAHSQVAS